MTAGELQPVSQAAIDEARELQRSFGPDEKGLTQSLVREIELRRALLEVAVDEQKNT